MKIDIASMPSDQAPVGFSEALTGQGDKVCWRVKEDATAPGGKVIAETSRDTADYRFPLCLRDDIRAKDVAVSVRFKAVAGEVDEAAGLVVRARDAMNYYITRANALEANVRLYKVTNGVRRQLAGHNTEVPSGTWQSLRLEASGEVLRVDFNGQPVIEARDDSIGDAGMVGLWTKADSLTHFAEFEIEPAPLDQGEGRDV
jgi:hypothetical protein